MILRRLFIRFVTPQIWRLRPRRKIAALYEFSSTEKDSGCQILAGLPAFKDPRDKAALLRHVLEEFHHSDLFSGLAKNYSGAPAESRFLNRKNILPPDASHADLLAFLAYAHAGEVSINRQFSYYNRGAYDPKIKNVFNKISRDESEHGEGMAGLLYKIGGPRPFYLRFLLVKAHFLHLKKQIEVYSSVFSDLLLKIALGAVYLGMGAFTSKTTRKRLDSMNGDELLALLKEEKRNIEA